MLLRSAADGLIAITQPAHARLSGDLATSWGNAQFAAPSGGEQLGAHLHDIGWLAWETHPEFDEDKRRPRVFADMPVAVHARLWEEGVRQASTIGRLLGVLVSLHAETIYEKTFDFSAAAPANVRLVRAFLDRQRTVRDELIAKSQKDARQADAVSPRRLQYAKRLIAAVDYMSLLICWGLTGGEQIKDAPASLDETVALELAAGKHGDITVSPWPFREDSLEVAVEGRRLPGQMSNEAAMRRALAEADYVTIECTLRSKAARSKPPLA